MENLYAKIGQRIVQIRHANNLTQYQLAEMLDISVKHCSAIERGKSSLSLEKMIDLCDIFWPDFDNEELYKAICEYQQRERRFGKTSEQIS